MCRAYCAISANSAFIPGPGQFTQMIKPGNGICSVRFSVPLRILRVRLRGSSAAGNISHYPDFIKPGKWLAVSDFAHLCADLRVRLRGTSAAD